VAVKVAGVDGCPGGWVGAVWDGGSGAAAVEWRALPLAFGPMLDALADCAVVAVDVPIGYADGPRPCDALAKQALGKGASSVFLVPPREVLEAPDYVTACDIGREKYGKALSKQMWFIRDRVLDATATLAAQEAEQRVVEAHPEVSFLRMTGRVLPPKKSAPGLAARLVALGEHFGDVPRLLETAPRPAAADDALDALACAWTARRVLAGQATVLGDGGMEIVS
jgi:predicted RNase H-like nuclease